MSRESNDDRVSVNSLENIHSPPILVSSHELTFGMFIATVLWLPIPPALIEFLAGGMHSPTGGFLSRDLVPESKRPDNGNALYVFARPENWGDSDQLGGSKLDNSQLRGYVALFL